MNNQDIAVKRFHAKNMNESELNQFMRELVMLSTLDHVNIVKFLAGSVSPPNFCIITEFVSPGNLQVVLRKKDEFELPWDLRVRMADDAGLGIAYLHSFDPPIMHRDLKSSNLLVTHDMRIKVADFGTSRQLVPTG